jgi:hypothetical protein
MEFLLSRPPQPSSLTALRGGASILHHFQYAGRDVWRVSRGTWRTGGKVMAGIWAQVALVFGLALAASVIAHRYRLSTALVEIIVGMAAGSILSAAGSYSAFAVQEP